MSSQYSIHLNSHNDTIVKFAHFNNSDISSPFVTFEISNDNNSFKMFMTSGEQYLSFLKDLAATVQKEIEKLGGSNQENNNA